VAAKICEFAHLQDEECGQVGRLDGAFGVEGRGVVPAAVVAVLVVRQRVSGDAAGGEPEPRPALQQPVGVQQFARVTGGQLLPQLTQGPAVDGGLDEVVENLGVRDGVGQGAGGVLMVEG
jgi:hypothetical protein